MQAGGGAASQAIAFLRANPVMMVGALAVLVGLVFGLYVYLQIANPRMFTRQVATRPQEPQPPAPPAVPQPAPPTADAATPGAAPVAAAPAAEPAPPAAAHPAPYRPARSCPPRRSPRRLSPMRPWPLARPGAAKAVVASAPPMDMPRAVPVPSRARHEAACAIRTRRERRLSRASRRRWWPRPSPPGASASA